MPEVSFDTVIKPLFQKDRDSMRRAFDTVVVLPTSDHSAAIAEHLKNGSMPSNSASPRTGSSCSKAGSNEACPRKATSRGGRPSGQKATLGGETNQTDRIYMQVRAGCPSRSKNRQSWLSDMGPIEAGSGLPSPSS